MSWKSRATVTVRRQKNALLVIVCGAMDAAEEDLLAAAWDEADEMGLAVTVVDLSGVTFGDSTLLNTLLQAQHRHHRSNRSLIIAGPLEERVHRLFGLAGVLPHLTFAAGPDEALDRDDIA